ncbi:MAG: galactosyldiacylglycerol synthase [Actinobacteria bacterium HGW-Actinobacteria-5]|jgi:1,2-diacylglycerol 3-beta-galactosyltransferase|nr:MAG: galactosyldiacylglycerol synthase [Actinobacteria bacterium HGW-Actinobacteria-5]
MSEQGLDEPGPKKRILFLFSDTGGGHRSATEAMIEALELEFPGRFEPRMVDFFREYYPSPLRFAPEIYPPISRVPQAWRFTFRAFDSKGRARAVTQISYPYVRRGAKRLVRENPADLIVSVHPLVNAHLVRAMRHSPIPYLTVVTDLVSTHALWYDRRADLVVVPTEEARDKAVEYGIAEGNLRVIGLPVADRFSKSLDDRKAWRERMGWRVDLPVILLVGGGDGMGPLKRVAKAVNEARLKATLVVICGRNAELKADLEKVDWKLPVHLYGFTTEMPQFMAASDMLVTKAGPGTISEAFISGLPLVLYARLPGQEDGNVSYVEKLRAGVWAPRPREVVDALRRWVDDPAARQRAAEASRRAAKPDAARQIARLIADQVGIEA